MARVQHQQEVPVAPLWRRAAAWRYFVPPEKGVWVWWLGPLLVGAIAAPAFTSDQAALALLATAAFLLKQPLTLLVRILVRGRNPKDFGPAAVWAALLGSVAALAATLLLLWRHYWLLCFAAAAMPFYAWYLFLLSRGDERHRPALDVAISGVLALAAPAAYLTGMGPSMQVAMVLWILCWLQSSASIIHVILRLEQRRFQTCPPLGIRLRQGSLPLAHHVLNTVVACALLSAGWAPGLAVVAMAIPLLEGLHAVSHPPVGATPKRLGMRQLAVSTAFFLVLALGYLGERP